MFEKSSAISVRKIFGSAAVDNPVPPRAAAADEWIRFIGTHDGKPASFSLTEDHLDKHILMVGSTGCGKTTTFIQLVNQLQKRMTNDDVMIIFDTKGDYEQKIKVTGPKLLIGNTEQYRQRSEKWNIFKEILLGHASPSTYDDEVVISYAQEISRSLFADREKRSNNPFFPNAARDLLAAIMIALCRTGFQPTVNPQFITQHLNNKALLRFLNIKDAEGLSEYLSFDEDLTATCAYIAGGGEQASGVLSELYSVARDVLTGVFAEEGRFSIRDFVRQRGKKTLFIEYDLGLGSMLTPVYRLLIDLALKEALSRQSGKGNVYIICDEFRLLPHLQHIDDGVNFGRSLGVKIIAGLQSIEQLFEVYQESRGRNIAAGFSTIFAFHSTDPATINYLSQAYGEYEVRETYQQYDGKMGEYRRTGNTISSWNLTNMDQGEAIICPAFGKPFTFKFDKNSV